MAGIKQYLCSGDPCILQCRPLVLFGILLAYLLHHRRLHRFHRAQHGLSLHHLSHLHLRSPNNLSTTPILHLNDTLLHRDRRDLCHPRGEALPSMKATPVGPLKSHRWTNGNLTSTSMTPTRSMGWISPRIRQSRFSSYKDIEGMDPLQVPLWKFLYQGLHNTWLRRVAYGRETFVLPFDNIGTTVFVAELVSQLRTRNVDLDKLATFRSRSAGQCVNQKEATQNMAKEVAQLLQSWLPAQPSADVASQQRILELEAELAKMKSDTGTSPSTAPEGSTPATTPIGRALQGQPAASTSFDPSSLLISPGSVNTWLVDNQPSSLSETQYKKWLKDLKLPQHKQDTLEKQLEKVNEWWQNQPDDASKTIQRASVAMGIDPCKHKGATTDDIVLKVMTVALLMHS